MRKLIIPMLLIASCTKPAAHKVAPIAAPGVDTVTFATTHTEIGLSKDVYLDSAGALVGSVVTMRSDSTFAIAGPAYVMVYFDHTPTNTALVIYTEDMPGRKCFKVSFR